jgi:hypothetical protein
MRANGRGVVWSHGDGHQPVIWLAEVFRELPYSAFADRRRVERMPIVTRDPRNDPVMRLVERNKIRPDLHLEGAVDAGGSGLMRFVRHASAFEQRTLHLVGAWRSMRRWTRSTCAMARAP